MIVIQRRPCVGVLDSLTTLTGTGASEVPKNTSAMIVKEKNLTAKIVIAAIKNRIV